MISPEISMPTAQFACSDVIQRLRRQIELKDHWYLALLDAVGSWTVPQELVNGRCYRYLIGGEAFDWLLLAERLTQSASDFIPAREMMPLLFQGKPPIEVTPDEFRKRMGSAKYRQHLNFFYGVTVEQALALSVQEEARKERWSNGYDPYIDTMDEAFCRIYNNKQVDMLEKFRRGKQYTCFHCAYGYNLRMVNVSD